MREKLKFYKQYDFAHNYYLKKAEEKLNTLDMSKKYSSDVNAIVEFYNVLKYSNIDEYNFKATYRTQLAYIHKQINEFISFINDSNFSIIYRKLDNDLMQDFWFLLDEYIKKLLISKNCIKKVFSFKRFHITYFLKCKNLAKQHNDILKAFLIKYENTAELLIKEYETIHEKSYMHLYFPIFSEDELNLIFTKYINSERVHINYLQAILDTTSSELSLTDEIRLLALQKINSEQKKLFNKNTGMKFGSIVGFGDFKEVKSFQSNGTEFTFQYDTKWIKDNLDFPTLLNNFKLSFFGFCF